MYKNYSHALHNDISINIGLRMPGWSHKIVLELENSYYQVASEVP